MATIYSQTPGGLFAQPGRAVTTFPSGLVRVDQTYICATADAEEHRLTLAVGAAMPDADTSPSMDGIFIHPEPQEVQRGDGFTEFKVSAYGRTKQEFTGLQLNQVVRFGTASVPPIPPSEFPNYVPIYGLFYEITGFIAIPFGYVLNIGDFIYDDSLSDALGFSQRIYGRPLDFSKIDDSNYNVRIGDYDAIASLGSLYFEIKSYNNFGSFCEVCVTVSRGIDYTTIN